MVSKQDATVASGGVPATDGTHTEYFYSTSLIINNLFTSSDVTLLSLRYNDTTISDILQLSFSSNLSFERKWRISPRLVIENRDNSSGTSRTSVKPRLLVNYRASRNWKFELDTGYEDSQTDGSVTTQSENAFYISLGYIYEF